IGPPALGPAREKGRGHRERSARVAEGLVGTGGDAEGTAAGMDDAEGASDSQRFAWGEGERQIAVSGDDITCVGLGRGIRRELMPRERVAVTDIADALSRRDLDAAARALFSGRLGAERHALTVEAAADEDGLAASDLELDTTGGAVFTGRLGGDGDGFGMALTHKDGFALADADRRPPGGAFFAGLNRLDDEGCGRASVFAITERDRFGPLNVDQRSAMRASLARLRDGNRTAPLRRVAEVDEIHLLASLNLEARPAFAAIWPRRLIERGELDLIGGAGGGILTAYKNERGERPNQKQLLMHGSY